MCGVRVSQELMWSHFPGSFKIRERSWGNRLARVSLLRPEEVLNSTDGCPGAQGEHTPLLVGDKTAALPSCAHRTWSGLASYPPVLRASPPAPCPPVGVNSETLSACLSGAF